MFDEDNPFRTDRSKVSHSLYIVQFGSLNLLLQKKTFRKMAERGTDLWVSQKLTAVILLLCSFSRTLVFYFPLVPWPMKCQVLGHLNNIRHGFPFVE